MKLPEFDIERYNSDDAEEHRIKILSEYLLECVKNRGDNFDDLSLLDDFQFEDFYFETVATVKRYYFTLNNWDYEKEKLMKGLTMSIARTKDLIKNVEFPNESCEQTKDEIIVEIKSQEEELKLLNETYSKIKWTMLYNYDSQVDNYNKPRERKKVGYKILVEFKKLIRGYNTKPSGNPKRLTTPVIIAMLKELGVLGQFAKKGFGRQSAIDTLYQIIGTNKTNIGKYYDEIEKSGLADAHQQEAKTFLNSKGY